MAPTSEKEEFVYQAVLSGALEIMPDGTIWRLALERGNRWNQKVGFYPVQRRQLGAQPNPATGYMIIKVMRAGRQVTALAHRLVYRHFKGPIPPGLTVNHINGRRSDNRPENLELATYVEQWAHAKAVLGRKQKPQDGELNWMAKLNAKAVREIRRRRAAGEKLNVLAKAFNVSEQTVSKVARRERWALVG